ncbi:hypothetical protein FQN57_000740 [Myotisia sp. PD_48]|nr:hypothetical protein FQN57_000740 [Myotisia sp. PD_48]
MPAYFYHISLEILRTPSSAGTDSYLTPSSPAFKSLQELLRPFRRKKGKPGNPDSRESTASTHPPPFKSQGDRQQYSTTDELRTDPEPSYLSHDLRHISIQEEVENNNPNTDIPAPFEKDKRLDMISIDGIDMISKPHDNRKPNDDSKNEITRGIGSDVIGGLATKGRYIPLDRESTPSVWGIVHLYRDAEESPSLCDGDEDPFFLRGSSIARNSRVPTGPQTVGASSASTAGGSRKGAYHGSITSENDAGNFPPPTPLEDCTTLCILAVPSYLSPSDFLGFVGEQTRHEVSHFRMIRTSRANRYMVLMKFRSGRKAKEWQKNWNGKVFNSMEPETCHVVFVKDVEIQLNPTGADNRFPDMKNDPFTFSGTQSAHLSSPTLSIKPLAPPTPSLIELPTCPVCLERMDETSGLLTIICQHVFHCTCLQKWKGSGCPVCRYTQDDITKRSINFISDEPTECSVCQSENNLWLCLICGYIGCGRYDGAHAFAHYKETSHSFAMDLSSQRVWDYDGDGYVHRIIQNKSDGKLVELPAADNSALDPPDWADAVPREKLENMSVEYTHLLTSQLESQRVYFEEQVERAADKASQASVAANTAKEIAEKLTQSLTSLQERYDAITQDSLPSLEREKDRAERRSEKFETMARTMEKQYREEKTMNSSLMERVEYLNIEVEKLKALNEDLSEQNRDLTFFISGTERLKDTGEDVIEGTVSVPDPPTFSSGRRKKGKRKGNG